MTGEPLRIGLTGGIASGKSTVAEMFADLGVPVIDTDVIARELVAPGCPALEEIRDAFGGSVMLADGSLDRAALRRAIFSDAGKRRRLESILHPRIGEETRRLAGSAGGPYQLIVVPLLVESPLRSFVDRVLVVDCDPDLQVQRLIERDADNEEQARRMIAAQASRAARLAIADDVIDNDGDFEQARARVRELHSQYLALASGS